MDSALGIHLSCLVFYLRTFTSSANFSSWTSFWYKYGTFNLIVQFTFKCKCYYLLWGLFSRVEWQFLYFGIWVSQRDLQWPQRDHRDHQYWLCLDREIRPKYWKRVCNQSNHLKIIDIWLIYTNRFLTLPLNGRNCVRKCFKP